MPITTALEIGDPIVASASFAVGSTPTDPTTLALTVGRPDGTTVSYSYPTDPIIVKDSAGAFHALIPATQAGQWSAYWVGTGVAAGTATATYYVYAGAAAKPLAATPLDVQGFVGKAFNADDFAFVGIVLELLQDEAELHINRTLGVRTQSWSTTLPRDYYSVFPPVTPIVSVQSIVVDGQTIDPGSYLVYPGYVVLSSLLAINYDYWLIGESQLTLNYTAGYDGRHLPGLRMLLIRVATREWLARLNDVRGIKRYSFGVEHYDFGDLGLEGFNERELAELSRYRKPVAWI